MVRLAAEQANLNGGLLGHPIKLVVEDTKSEPNTAATVATIAEADDRAMPHDVIGPVQT